MGLQGGSCGPGRRQAHRAASCKVSATSQQPEVRRGHSLLPWKRHTSSRAARAAALCRACCRKPDSRDTAARDATHVRLHREGAHSPAQEQMKTNLSWLLQLHQLSATRFVLMWKWISELNAKKTNKGRKDVKHDLP